MYNRLQKYLKDQNILYDKQFGFQTGHSTEHAIAQLVDKIYKAFEKNKYTLGVFIDLSKAFDTVDHAMLLKKLEIYGITIRGLLLWNNILTAAEKTKESLPKFRTAIRENFFQCSDK